MTDERVAATLVWKPQPFGIEAEWTVGRRPEWVPESPSIESEFLHGGDVQSMYRVEQWHGGWYPFVRWQYYEGGRKFASNAPHSIVNAWDVGLEWQPWPEFEVSISCTRTLEGTHTLSAPYEASEDADRLGFQAQFNF